MYNTFDPISNGLNAFGIGNDSKLLTMDYFETFRAAEISDDVAKYAKFAKWLGFAGSALTTAYSTVKVVDQYNNGGVEEVFSHRDVLDATVGAVGLTATVLTTFALVSNPVGWAIGLGVLIYGAATFIYDQTHPEPQALPQKIKL